MRPRLIRPVDPGVENSQSLMMGQLTVFPDQDHIAHIEAHRAFMSSYLVRNNPQVATILQAHVVEHTSALARQEVMMESGPALQAEIQKFGGDVPPEVVTEQHTKPWILITALFFSFVSVGSGWRRRKTLEKSKELAAKTDEIN